MGLDSVEIVMELEERFGLAISDEDWMKIATPRQAIELIEDHLTIQDDPPCQTQRAFYRLRRVLMGLWGVGRGEIELETPLRRHVRFEEERAFWQALKERLGARRWPEPDLSPRWHLVLWGGTVAPLIVGPIMTVAAPDIAVAALMAAGLAAIGVHRGLSALLRPRRIHIPTSFQTVCDLVPFAVSAEGIAWSRKQIEQGVKEVTLRVLHIEEGQYGVDLRFVEDLGMD